MRVLITGIHGFIGASVGNYALSQGNEVLGIGLSAQAPEGWQGSYRLADVATADMAGLIGDFAPELVFHGAGAASVGHSYDAPLDDLRSAVSTWANTLDGVRRSGVQPMVVFPSSAAVYGNPRALPVAEDAPINPISPYGFHKRACELIAREYSECFGLDVAVLRLFSMYGPRQRRLLLWELFERATGDAVDIVLHGTGKESRDYLYADDLAQTVLALAALHPTGLQVVNTASGTEITVAELAAQVAAAVGVDKTVRPLGGAQVGNPVHWRADITRLTDMGIAFGRPFADGLSACVAAWR